MSTSFGTFCRGRTCVFACMQAIIFAPYSFTQLFVAHLEERDSTVELYPLLMFWGSVPVPSLPCPSDKKQLSFGPLRVAVALLRSARARDFVAPLFIFSNENFSSKIARKLVGSAHVECSAKPLDYLSHTL